MTVKSVESTFQIYPECSETHFSALSQVSDEESSGDGISESTASYVSYDVATKFDVNDGGGPAPTLADLTFLSGASLSTSSHSSKQPTLGFRRSAVTHKQRQRPVCLFVNYFGSRLEKSPTDEELAKDNLNSEAEGVDCSYSSTSHTTPVSHPIDSPAKLCSTASLATEPTIPYYRLLCPCKLKFPVHLKNLKNYALPALGERQMKFPDAIPINLTNLRLPTKMLHTKTTGDFVSEYDGHSKEPNSKRQKVEE